MSWARVAISRVRALFARAASERDLEEEIRFHVDMQMQEHLRSGMSLGEARTTARRDFGRFDTTKEHYRDVRGVLWLETSCRDILHASRSLARDGVFSFVAILSLMLGIGGSGAIFGLIDTVLLRSLPVRTPEQLRFLREVGGGSSISYFSQPWYKQIRDHPELIDGTLAFFDADGTLLVSANADRSGAQPELVRAQLVSGNYFSVLGVRPATGREFSIGR